MQRSSRDLMAEFFPGVSLDPETGQFETLLSIAKANKVLGYEPKHSWRGRTHSK